MRNPAFATLDAPDLSLMFHADEKYRPRMNIRPGEEDPSFLFPSEQGPALLAEKRAILEKHPERHVDMFAAGVPIQNHLITFLGNIGVLDAHVLNEIQSIEDPIDRCTELSCRFEPDVLLLQGRDKGKQQMLVGGSVCFPSSWKPTDKMGLDVFSIHEVVPHLNAELSSKIRTFLSHLQPGQTFIRSDWGLKRVPDLNHHPLQNLPGLDESVTLEDIHIRIERQMFVGLPPSETYSSTAFCIRIAMYRALDFIQHEKLRAGFEQTLRTMPEDMAEYKGIAKARPRLVELFAHLTATPASRGGRTH